MCNSSVSLSTVVSIILVIDIFFGLIIAVFSLKDEGFGMALPVFVFTILGAIAIEAVAAAIFVPLYTTIFCR